MSEKHYPYIGGSFDRIVFDGDGSVWVPEPENAQLRERITTQKQTIQAYQDESREWREVAERAQAENAKLRELALDFYDAIDSVFWDGETETKERFKPRLRELGVEVEA